MRARRAVEVEARALRRTVAHDERGDAARTVAALLRLRAVGVPDAIARDGRGVARCFDGDDLVAPDARVAIGERATQRRIRRGLSVPEVDHDEVVACAVHFREAQGAAAGRVRLVHRIGFSAAYRASHRCRPAVRSSLRRAVRSKSRPTAPRRRGRRQHRRRGRREHRRGGRRRDRGRRRHHSLRHLLRFGIEDQRPLVAAAGERQGGEQGDGDEADTGHGRQCVTSRPRFARRLRRRRPTARAGRHTSPTTRDSGGSAPTCRHAPHPC